MKYSIAAFLPGGGVKSGQMAIFSPKNLVKFSHFASMNKLEKCCVNLGE